MQTPFGSRSRAGAVALVIAGLAPAPLLAQDPDPPTPGIRGAILRDIGALEQKYLSLADVLTDHFAWRPGEGVRSVSEVFVHIAGATIFIPVAMDVAPPAGMEVDSFDEGFERMFELERTTTGPDAVQELLRTSFDHARHVVASVPESDLEDEIEFFGETFTKLQGLLGLVTHMHEHLGQAVAYARMNGVVPPWSR